ncbi:transporter substrate-binding domain-containing protein [Rheinheimera maricola]|uniref:Transporter substrate-binding domain-containing protein n=1 Tax=Rheinheimera maricola TaxID=2793282 RepID=A0ABS7XB11_9GAMM|nr:transporter substrate-binding domain-containing protein [Rheinheimera maricola]MBZ9612727.1 transporter substrate-binding domain-containing protein [Rheinheimera maricola]
MVVKTICSLLFVASLIFSGWSRAELPQQLNIALSKDSYPYMFVNEHGEIDGLAVEYWREVARRSGVNIDFIVADWPDTIKLLQDGKVHLHGAMARTVQRSSRFNLIDLNVDAFSNVYVRRDLSGVSSITDLQPFVVGVVQDTGHLDALKQHLPDGNFKYFANVTELYAAALAGQVAAFAGLDRLPTQHPRYQELNQIFPLYSRIALRRIELAYALLPEHAQLAEQLQLAVAKLDRSFVNELERRWLGYAADSGTLLLGLSVDNPPYMNVSLQGEAQGLFVDLWRHWSDITGQKIAFVPDTSFNNLQNLAKGRIDAVIGLPDNNMLPESIISAYQIYGFKSEYFTLQQSTFGPLTALSQSKVGVFENAPYLPELRQRYPNTEFIRFRQLSEMLNAVINKKLSGFFAAAAVVPFRLQQLNMTDLFQPQQDTQVVAPIYSLVRSDRPELAEQISKGFTSFSLDKFIQLESKWVSNTSLHYFMQFRKHAPLTTDERTWLTQHQQLRLGILNNWPPMEFIDDGGNAAGVTVDMFKLLSDRLDMSIELVLYTSFEHMLSDLQQQNIDIIANISEQEDRRDFAVFTNEFWSTQWAAISPGAEETITSTRQLNNKKVAVYQDYQLAKHLNSTYPDIKVVPVATLQQGLIMLQKNEVDYVLDSIEAATEMLKQQGHIYMRIQILDDLPSFASLIAVRKDYAPLADILNKGLRSISKEDRQELYQKWFSFQITQGINKEQLNRLMWQIGGAALMLLAFFVLWNLSLRREVRLRRQAEQKMRFMATHDDLTRLPNRSLIRERIEQALLQHARHNELLAILFIDLDGFKDVNDAHGHDAGDELLLKVAAILKDKVRKSDTVARFGGDEFVILLTGLLSRDDAAIVAEKILHQLAQPLTLSMGDVQVGASIGIAIYPDDGTDSAKLLKVADSLMYRIKQQGKNQYCFSRAVFS